MAKKKEMVTVPLSDILEGYKIGYFKEFIAVIEAMYSKCKEGCEDETFNCGAIGGEDCPAWQKFKKGEL